MPSTLLMDTSPMVRQKYRTEDRKQCLRSALFAFLEESLGQLDVVQAQLAKDEQDLQNEIAQLQEELRLQQDPGRMQLIQEMISVCLREAWISCLYTYALLCIRIFWDRCLSSGKRLPSLKPLSATSQETFKFSTRRKRTLS